MGKIDVLGIDNSKQDSKKNSMVLADAVDRVAEYDDANMADDLYDELDDVENDIEEDSLYDDADLQTAAKKIEENSLAAQLKLLKARMRKIERIRTYRRKTPRTFDGPERLGVGGKLAFGWLKSGQIFASGTVGGQNSSRCSILTGNLYHPYRSLKPFMSNWQASLAGAYSKVTTGAVVAVAGAATVATLNGVFGGAILQFTDTNLNADFSPFVVQIDAYLTSGGAITNSFTFLFKPNNPISATAILLTVSLGGVGQIARFEKVVATVAADKIRAGSKITLESVNQYDIRDIQ